MPHFFVDGGLLGVHQLPPMMTLKAYRKQKGLTQRDFAEDGRSQSEFDLPFRERRRDP